MVDLENLIITSNYTIEQLFWSETDQELCAAIKRRFEEIEFTEHSRNKY